MGRGADTVRCDGFDPPQHAPTARGQRPAPSATEQVSGLRFMTWNVKGAHDDLHTCYFTQKWLRRSADIVAFTESGYRGKPTPALKGFKRLVCSERPRHSARERRTGGVAVYVAHAIAARVSVVRDEPKLGHVWFKVREGGHTIFVCAVYLPPQASAYYGGADGSLSADAHWQAITSGIVKYRGQGEIILMGDFNARTGSAGGGNVSEGRVDQMPAPLSARDRVSRDTGPVNPAGKWLLQLEADEGLLILNGRTPGDVPGALTFHAAGRNATSVADYFLVSPALALAGDGSPREGVKLTVLELQRCPRRPIKGRYDHCPVILTLGTLPTTCASPPASAAAATQRPMRYRWPAQGGTAYGKALLDEAVAHRIAAAASADTVDAEQVQLEGAVRYAAELLHASGEAGAVAIPAGGGGGEGRPHNTWYGDGCKEAFRAARDAERMFGPAAPETRDRRKEYKKVTRQARRVWEAQEFKDMVQDLRHAPKRFWRRCGQGTQEGGLRDVAGWTQYFEGLFGAPADDATPPTPSFHPPTAAAVASAEDLNKPITVEEVQQALEAMRGGKSPGVDGMPVEFYKHAWVPAVGADGELTSRHALLDPITHLLDRVLREGYPRAWQVGATSPVPKPKGSLDCRDDYRGITVGGALARLYSLVLNTRLDALAEENGYRARGQAGFRKGRGTPDNAFILNHVIERSRSEGSPVYAGFIDFRKAYDSVDRSILWECLAHLGVHGNFMRSLQAMYDGGGMCVRIGGEVGPAFVTHKGVQQGDPLSPLLFGLLIDTLEDHFQEVLPQAGVPMGRGHHQQLLSLLLYADDLVLLAKTRTELQQQLDALNTFCTIRGLTVNVRKSEVVVFNPPSARVEPLNFAGQVLPTSTEFVYLGMPFHATMALRRAVDRSVAAARRAMHALLCRLNALNIHNIRMRCYLFDTLVRPVLNYGCEVWGPGVLGGPVGRRSDSGASCMHGTMAAGAAAANALQTQFLRQSLGVRQHGQRADILAMETGRRPLTADWLLQAARLWDVARARPDGDLLKEAMRESWQLAEQTPLEHPRCWAAHFRLALHREGHALLWTQDGGRASVAALLAQAQASWLATAGDLGDMPAGTDALDTVRTVPANWSHGFKMLVYKRWMYAEELGPPAMGWDGINDYQLIGAMARFRMGVHRLRIETGRHDRTSRNDRICRLCETGAREDEAHIVFDCPAFTEAREAAFALFTDLPGPEAGLDARMKAFMNPRPGLYIPGGFWRLLAKFLRTCQDTHASMLGMLEVEAADT